jgi:hypothetical protein
MQEKGVSLLSKVITTMGERSAQAQKLKQVITTPSKFYSSDQRLYLKVSGNKALGFIKVGERNLFYHDNVLIALPRWAPLNNLLPPASLIFMFISRANAVVSAR